MRHGWRSAILLALMLLLLPLSGTERRELPFMGSMSALAVEPEEMLDDPELERRAREISKNLRCLVCQNENIDESNAPLAKDLRILLRERLKAGDTDEQAVQFIVDRYGEYVLLKPRFGLHTLVLWVGPFIVLLIAIAAALYAYRRVRSAREARQVEAPLSEEEKRRLAELMKETGQPQDT
jgi:cytochrome c-type biogenesis protein CcmH